MRPLLPAALLCLTGLATIDTADAAFIRRGNISKQGNIGSYRTTMLVAEDSNDEVDSVAVELTDADGNTESLTLSPNSSSGAGVVFEADADLDSGSYTVEATMLDDGGEVVGETYTATVEVPEAGEARDNDFTLDGISIEQIEGTAFRLTVDIGSDPHGEVASIVFSFGSFGGEEPLYEEDTITTSAGNGAKHTFSTDGITFENVDGAIGESYEVIIDFYDSEDGHLGSESLSASPIISGDPVMIIGLVDER